MAAEIADTAKANLNIVQTDRGRIARLSGKIILPVVPELARQMAGAGDGPMTIDLSAVEALDTAGAWLIATSTGQDASLIVGTTPAQDALIAVVRSNLPQDADTRTAPGVRQRVLAALDRLGRQVESAGKGLVDLLGFFGLVVARLVGTILHPSRLRVTALVHHMQEAGMNAVPIVALLSFLIGIVLAFQGADQLTQFGAEIFVVDLISLSILRELGILLTAIIVAGRSASAFTASIGSMKMREEIDAMPTLGLDPIELLVLPRVLALFIMLPLLGFIADIAGLFGGALMSWYQLGVSPGMFMTRLLETDVSHFLVGISKAPFFAVIIAVIGCFQGMRVEGNTESLGRLTSRSVVQAIFMVILADATFSIFFAAVGI